MMARRAIILVACFFAFIALTLWLQVTIQRETDRFIVIVNEVDANYEQREKAMELYTELDKQWEDKVFWWAMIIPHEELMDVTIEIKNLGVALRVGNQDDAVLAVSNINLQMAHLVERNTLRTDHVF